MSVTDRTRQAGALTTDSLSDAEVVSRIDKLTAGLMAFWSKSSGWAPVSAAGLLSKSRLDWQSSLASALRTWTREPPATLTDGKLILAWTNLGALPEGSLKLLFSVYYENFKSDVEALKAANAFDHKGGKDKPPDGLGLESLRVLAKRLGLLGGDGDKLAEIVQQRRNAIHAFKDRPLGDDAEFRAALRDYLGLLRGINDRLPYPEDIYVPLEL